MAGHNDGVNPLRPYYIPPSIGEPPEALPTPGPRAFAQSNSTGRYASKARDIFSDIDYKDYIAEPSPSVVSTIKEVLDELLWKYTSVLMAQPFEVAKTIMQVRAQDDVGGLAAAAEAAEEARLRQASQRINMHDRDTPSDSDSDLDESAFFTSHQPRTPSPTLARPRNQRHPSSQSPRAPHKAAPAHQLAIRTPDSVLEVIAQLWQKEGAWGVWKGSNATFIYSVLQSLLENWSRSLLSALFNVPDLGVKNDTDRLVDLASPYPWASLFVAAAAAVTTGLILAPLDLVRTRLVITSTASRASRRTLSTLRSLPSYLCPSSLVVPTVLHSLIHPLLTLSTPLVLRSHFMIDRELAPTTFSIAKFCSSTVALLLKLPLETVLRRGQVAVLSSPAYLRALEGAGTAGAAGGGRRLDEKPAVEMETVVPLGRYDGVVGTMYAIVYEEGSHAVPASAGGKAAAARKGRGGTTVSETVYRRGQGLDGLWRGWKVSWWGLVGLWAAGVLGGGGDGEF
ncbi:mitochondrial fusion and transport protein ugo1 [Achaetomium macrosporum]|uniref:Mitochondrial fusion and transport protein ugo1 n=1 Tax=Achaetomium macrosporum TaxID=79813 RepID=A0AAN7HEW3_9PEZI|nr:mitochondrial fusion and transport protein ugo1 [Achaetomium macrosporum]